MAVVAWSGVTFLLLVSIWALERAARPRRQVMSDNKDWNDPGNEREYAAYSLEACCQEKGLPVARMEPVARRALATHLREALREIGRLRSKLAQE
jgi:hypothetical protein